MTFPIVGTIRRLGVDPCAYVPGLYTQAEVDDLINIDGYIPVADADEFSKIRTGAVETMGGCSIWAGSYTTGADKNYIQIFDIDFSAFGTWTTSIPSFIGLYDGNELNISNITGTASPFTSTTGLATFKNVRVVNVDMTGSNRGGIVAEMRGGLIQNCTASGTMSGGNFIGGILGRAYTLLGDLVIEDCDGLCTIVATGSHIGGIAGQCQGTYNVTVSRCRILADVRGRYPTGGILGSLYAGGVVQDCQCINATIYSPIERTTGGIIGITFSSTLVVISRCRVIDSIVRMDGFVNTSSTGGILGQNFSTVTRIEECEVVNSEINGGDRVGGICGWDRSNQLEIINCKVVGGQVTGRSQIGGVTGRRDSSIDSVIVNTYSATIVTGTGSNIGGMIGFSSLGSNVNSYWDTTIGPATSEGGTGQTTVALQAPTSNTGIYSAWDAAVWSFGTSTDYPELINTP